MSDDNQAIHAVANDRDACEAHHRKDGTAAGLNSRCSVVACGRVGDIQYHIAAICQRNKADAVLGRITIPYRNAAEVCGNCDLVSANIRRGALKY